MPRYVIALSYSCQGKLAETREPAEEAFRIAPWARWLVGFLAGVLAQAGETDRAEKLISTIRTTFAEGMIIYHWVCADIDAAIDWYERDIELRQPFAAIYTACGFFKRLRAGPRWSKLARMMNLPAGP